MDVVDWMLFLMWVGTIVFASTKRGGNMFNQARNYVADSVKVPARHPKKWETK